MQRLLRTSIAALGLALTATTADAQDFTFYTTGQFSSGFGSCNGSNVCTNPNGGVLTFTGNGTVGAPVNLIAPTATPFGTFLMSFPNTATSGSFPADASFTLWIYQTAPTAGSVSAIGSITGSLTSSASGQVLWAPTQTSFTIGSFQYNLQTAEIQGQQGYAIGAPNAGSTSIQGNVTHVPEPASFALVAAGLAGLGVVARRRQRA